MAQGIQEQRLPTQETVPASRWRLNLFEKFPFLKRAVKSRGFQFWLVLPNLVLFYLFILAGLFGTPIGSHNIIIVFVWIMWWFLLIAVLVPFGGRVWCTMCPLPFFGDWLQRRALVRVRTGGGGSLRNKLFGLNKRWPSRLSNIWLQNLGFLFLAIFSALLVTRPIVSVAVFAGLIALAAILAYVYRMRSFCNYVCPISGFLSLYSMTSMMELRPVSDKRCKECKDKSCIRGSEDGWACSWNVYMGKLDRNNYCGLCMECVKSCPNDNVALFARPFAADTKLKGFDEVWKACIMLVLALSYSVVLLGPWRQLKNWANISQSHDWSGFAGYAVSTVLLALVVMPGLLFLFVGAGKRLANAHEFTTRDLFIRLAYTLVPLGLFAWIAFSIPLVMINGAYIVAVASDPLGWGMNLFGTAGVHWQPVLPAWVPYIQVPVLLSGLYWALRTGFRVALELFGERMRAVRALAPLSILLTAITIVFLTLFVG
ncbi:MAG: 4Fe-4S binding protein [Acidobacteriota bacterium]|nr:4Fe-4S binding protein [Acidobacteriota bacterium]